MCFYNLLSSGYVLTRLIEFSLNLLTVDRGFIFRFCTSRYDNSFLCIKLISFSKLISFLMGVGDGNPIKVGLSFILWGKLRVMIVHPPSAQWRNLWLNYAYEQFILVVYIQYCDLWHDSMSQLDQVYTILLLLCHHK